MQELCHVVCICCCYGFPNGMAQTARIKSVGKALVNGGCRFTVLNIGGGLCPNVASSGEVEGIFYEFLPGRTTRPENPVIRYLTYAKGTLQVTARLYELRKKEQNLCVYSWFSGGNYALFHRYLRLIGCPVVQEVNEWWPGEKQLSFRNRNLALTQGTIAISSPIITRLKNLPAYTAAHRILKIPILVEPDEWILAGGKCRDTNDDIPYVLWCGDMNYTEDIYFLMRAVRIVNNTERCRLVLVGSLDEKIKRKLFDFAKQINLQIEMLSIRGYVPDDKLRMLMDGAEALLLPLWETERSICRFPTKLGQYLSSGTAVVATRIGSLGEYLRDMESACLVLPNDTEGFAQKIAFLLRNKELARTIGKAGREIAIQYFNIQANQKELVKFFVEILNRDGKICTAN
jgi:glycosyltransferase involved in cell wall biosynthesis